MGLARKRAATAPVACTARATPQERNVRTQHKEEI
nr:MAG TPA: hypothetical protein [Caudoviricetes sp.]DAI10941.1 MAG TPA: hypothetical protein [Caudoviricetes sp.]